ncbi:heparin lyase I family protein [Paraburkholderia silviterrae]|uniref:Uncharacterized protein n=1 Tax=Paraburkholderia silviterrae TaxID=2528715 RepID=A0A4R5MC56_9BURK|nr:heparin lyase I family protein [Paraburkholderia silviterrae]TDG24429.1 hypothetical protein EYW47_07640 [Paraburkholderia silviterrae]
MAPELVVQKASPDDVVVVDDPVHSGRKAVKVTISLDEDYSHVANGAPRAEIVFPGSLRFEVGHHYLIRWSTYIPSSFVPDDDESVVITQIHQGGCCSGPPPIMLTIRGDHYEFAERSDVNGVRQQVLRKIKSDIGRWVNWVLRYVPDPSGVKSRTELRKDDVVVYSSDRWPNAYSDDQTSYLKIGLYKSKWDFKNDANRRLCLLFGDILISERGEGSLGIVSALDSDTE